MLIKHYLHVVTVYVISCFLEMIEYEFHRNLSCLWFSYEWHVLSMYHILIDRA